MTPSIASTSMTEDVLRYFARKVIPKLSHATYKGNAGKKIAVVGGSSAYAGAAHYAARASARAGSDLVYVLTSHFAKDVVKGYCCDHIVIGAFDESEFCGGRDGASANANANASSSASSNASITQWLARVDGVCVGPGLGNNRIVLDHWRASASALGRRRGRVPTVYDADGLRLFWEFDDDEAPRDFAQSLLENDLEEFRGGNARFSWDVATPNKMELFRLVSASVRATGERALNASDEDVERMRARCTNVKDLDLNDEWVREELVRKALRRYAPVHFLLKGEVDWLLMNDGAEDDDDEPAFVPIAYQGAPKRCGGQGDILAGILVTFLAWARASCDEDPQTSREETRRRFTSAVAASCFVTKSSAARAFTAFGRGMQASDMLDHIPAVFAAAFDAEPDL